MSRSSIVTVVLSAALVALLALQVATSMRLAKLQDQVSKLEERPAGSGGAGAAGDPARNSAGTNEAAGTGASGNAKPADAGSSSGTGTAGGDNAAGSAAGAHKPAARAADGALSEKDIEALIEKKLAAHDKKNPLAQIMNFEDPMVVMERELKLSSIQKTRIGQHMKERDDATMELYQGEEARKDWKGTEAKVEEIRKKCDESVKRELDLAQQDKYEELKKSGKLMDFGSGGGMSIMIGGPAKSGDEGTDPAPPDGK
jgi:hypothetical protein